MRKFLVALLLPVLMLLTQQAQAWHEIGHLQGTPTEQKQDALGGKLCSLCFSFAQLDAAPAPQAPQLAPAALTQAAPETVTLVSREVDAPVPGNRDPPRLA